MTTVGAVVVAAGRGLRAGGGRAKQYRVLNGETPLRRSLAAFVGHPDIKVVQPVIHPADEDLFAEAASGMALLPAVHGGTTRQESVRAGLEALASAAPDIVLIHDAARPFLTPALIDRAVEAAVAAGAAVPGMPVVDTVKRVDANGVIMDTLPRDALRIVQTPQAFRFAPLLDAHRRAAAEKRNDFTDDGALAEWAGMAVSVFPGEASNVKLTTADDFAAAERGQHALEVRTATGFDVHQFGPGDHVMLGGVRIPHDRGVIGHSDADVALHALTDALLGALAEGDIGTHFPPSDPQWKGASSDRFLAFASQRVTARGGRITLLDVTMLSEAPRIGPHRDAIRQRIAEITGVHIGRVAIKATTTEQLGFVGRREGLAAIATATIQLPGDAP